LGTTIWSPLASGLLTGKYNQGISSDFRLQREELAWLKDQNLVESNLNTVRKLTAFASDLGISLAQMAIAWTLVNPQVSTAILGASRVEQLQENLKALEAVPLLTPEVMNALEGILNNKPVLPPY
jgi:aryl-alcohol dehydrogenase-like predicted oxidoreductase